MTCSFELVLPRRIVFAEGSIEQVGSLAATLGRRAVLVTGRRWLASSGHLPRLEQALVEAGLIFQRIAAEPEPTCEHVEELLLELRRFNADCVIAIGGGSVIDVGKALAILLANEGGPMDYIEGVGHGRRFERPALPVLAAPTTAGTGAEATRNSVLGNRARTFKKSIRDDSMIPAIALVDPALLADCPADVAAACGMDALAQLLESLLSRRSAPLTDALARRGLEGAALLEDFVRDSADSHARAEMALASLHSGICLANAGLGSVHALASPLGARFPAPHGAVCAALLPAAVELNARLARERGQEDVLEKYAFAWRVLGDWGDQPISADPFAADDPTELIDSPFESALALARHLARLRQELGIPGLAAWGVIPADFDALIKDAGPGNLATNPVELDHDDLASLLAAAL